MGVEYIYADAWSAPGYMKTNDDYVSSNTKSLSPSSKERKEGKLLMSYNRRTVVISAGSQTRLARPAIGDKRMPIIW